LDRLNSDEEIQRVRALIAEADLDTPDWLEARQPSWDELNTPICLE